MFYKERDRGQAVTWPGLCIPLQWSFNPPHREHPEGQARCLGGRVHCRQGGFTQSADSGWMMISIWKNHLAKNNSSRSEPVLETDAPKLCHHLGNEFSFFNTGCALGSLREAIWPGPFPTMWVHRCIQWFGLEPLLETSQVPEPQGSPWSGCSVCWVLQKMQRGSGSQIFKPAILFF